MGLWICLWILLRLFESRVGIQCGTVEFSHGISNPVWESRVGLSNPTWDSPFPQYFPSVLSSVVLMSLQLGLGLSSSTFSFDHGHRGSSKSCESAAFEVVPSCRLTFLFGFCRPVQHVRPVYRVSGIGIPCSSSCSFLPGDVDEQISNFAKTVDHAGLPSQGQRVLRDSCVSVVWQVWTGYFYFT
jgi:hypothetical protein